MEFRYARHTDQLEKMVAFYTEIIGLEVLFSFEGHNGYDGVFLGKPDLDWHLEFTTSGDKAEHTFDEDDLLVFYPTKQDEYLKMVKRIEDNNIKKIKAKNPYWDDHGIVIRDPDGYGVIICNLRVK